MSSSLPMLFRQATELTRKEMLCSCTVYPRTRSLNDNPVCTINVDEAFHYANIIEQVQGNPEMISLRAQSDLELILEVLSSVHDELYVEQFDSVRICRSGVNLLCIQNSKRDVNRSLSIEINDYRHRLQESLKPKQTGWVSFVIVSALIAIVSMGMQAIVHKRVR